MSEEHEPYLQVTLDAIRKAAHVALAAKAQGHPITRNDVLGGLLDLWDGCWRRKSSRVTRLTILGCFGADISPELAEFGFLAPEDGGFRAKGSGKYLRIAEGQSKGGHASKKNLIPGPHRKEEPEGSRRGAGTGAGGEPEEISPAPPPAPSGSSSEQRTANTEHRTAESQKHVAGAPLSPPAAHEVLQAVWNETRHPSLPKWLDSSKSRRKAAREALKSRSADGPGGWREVIQRIGQSAFCRGETERGWRANPDWLLKPTTAGRVLEGQYDDTSGPIRDIRRGYAESAAWTPEEIAEFNAQGTPEVARG